MARVQPKEDGLIDDAAFLGLLGEVGLALFHYDSSSDQVDLRGDLTGLGYTERTSVHSLSLDFSNLKTAVDEPSAHALEELRQAGRVGEPLRLFVRLRGGQCADWRGARLEDASVAGVILPRDSGTERRLADRPGFLSVLSARLNAGETLTLGLASVSRLRELNSALGYQRADQLLEALAERLSAAFPQGCAARVGEKSFAIMASDLDAEALKSALHAALAQPVLLDADEVHPHISLGGARGDARTGALTLLRLAESDLGVARAERRERQAASGAEGGDILHRLSLESELKGAVARGEIEPFFQPIVRLADGRLSGFEALARWRHPRRGLLPPDDFLPLASDPAVMSQIGRFMARSAAVQVASWRRQGLGVEDLFVSVNLTIADLESGDLTEEIRSILAEADLPLGMLKFEITEGEAMRNPERVVERVTELRALGASVSLDDFGMGYSSFSWLARLPIQGLKIDKYFVRTLGVSEASEKIVRTIVNLARDFDLVVVAEGVETQEAATALKEIGCDYGQGFAYAPPIAAEETQVFLIEYALNGCKL